MSESFFRITIWVDALRFPVAFSHCSNIAFCVHCVLYERIDFVLFLHIKSFAGQCLVNPQAGNICALTTRVSYFPFINFGKVAVY